MRSRWTSRSRLGTRARRRHGHLLVSPGGARRGETVKVVTSFIAVARGVPVLTGTRLLPVFATAARSSGAIVRRVYQLRPGVSRTKDESPSRP